MDQRSRSRLVAGIVLVFVGLVFLVAQLVPGISALLGSFSGVTMIIVFSGLMLFIVGLAAGVPDMAIPASIVTGVGAIIAYQISSGNWASWSYLWTLIPGFVGIGIIIAGLIKGEGRHAIRAGGNLVLISLVLLVIFGAFFTAVLGGPNNMGVVLPAALIVVGVVLLIRALLRKS